MPKPPPSTGKNNAKNKEVFYVEDIIGHKEKNGKKHFLVKWAGYEPEHNSWEPEESFLNSEFLKKYEMRLSQERRTEPSSLKESPRKRRRPHRGLTPMSADNSPSASTVVTRQRKSAYKRSSAEKDSREVGPTKSTIVVEPDHLNPSSQAPDDSLFKEPFPIKRRAGRSQKSSPLDISHPDETSSMPDKYVKNSIKAGSRHDSRRITPSKLVKQKSESEKELLERKTAVRLLQGSKEDEEYPFELHRHNGLIGEEINEARFDQLIKEMDEALERVDGYTLVDEPNVYLSRLILIAKRPLGMVGYCRLEHEFEKTLQFECVPLEILIAKYPDDVLEYMQEQMKINALREYRRQARHKQQADSEDNPSRVSN